MPVDPISYLEQFGYIAHPRVESFGFGQRKAMAAPLVTGLDDSRRAARIQNAVLAFQMYVGLTPTGELDEPTLEFMERKRCGVPDMGTFTLAANKWGKTALTYRLNEVTPDLSIAVVRSAIAQALGLWSAVSPLTFSEVTTVADLEVWFVHGDHGDGNPFDGANGVLAHAYFPTTHILGGDAHFDEAETWVVAGGGIDLATVAAHEFGHSLGLGHTNVQGALMYPYYGGPAARLSADDIAGIQQLYGAKPAPPPPTPPPPPPPTPPTPPTYVAFSMVGRDVYHDYHWVRGTLDRRYTSFQEARDAGKRPCGTCKPGG